MEETIYRENHDLPTGEVEITVIREGDNYYRVTESTDCRDHQIFLGDPAQYLTTGVERHTLALEAALADQAERAAADALDKEKEEAALLLDVVPERGLKMKVFFDDLQAQRDAENPEDEK